MMLLLTLRGTPTIYYGDELGMEDGAIPPQQIQDPAELNAPGLGLGRDPERTPMQWDSGPRAGFCPAGVAPWLPVNANAATVNVARQRAIPDSMLNFTRQLLTLRRARPALSLGSYQALDADGQRLAYLRTAGDDRCLIVLNFDAAECAWTVPQDLVGCQIIAATHPGARLSGSQLLLPAYGGAVLGHPG